MFKRSSAASLLIALLLSVTLFAASAIHGGSVASSQSTPTSSRTTLSGALSFTIFGRTIPKITDSGDPNSVELGLKFRPLVDGRITGIRFYKAKRNTGTHVGSLWSIGGHLLASAKFRDESRSGWQSVTFAKPVSVKAGTTYVAGYFTHAGNYAIRIHGLKSPIKRGPLEAVRSGPSGNGVYAYATHSTFPSSAYAAASFYVDVSFTPTPALGVLLGNSSVGSQLDNEAAGLADAFSFVAASSGTASQAYVYVDSGSSASGLSVGVYADASGAPGALLTSGTLNSPASSSWDAVQFASPISVTSGTTYWIAILGSGNQLNFRDENPGSANCSITSSPGLTALPATWTSGATEGTCSLSAVVSTSAGTAPADPPQYASTSTTNTPGVTFTPIDGGSNYFANLSSQSAWADNHMLLGGWEEQPQDLTEVGYGVAMGENLYWNLSGGSADYNVINQGGMHVQAPSEDVTSGAETIGYQGTDEPDMNFGPGTGQASVTDSDPFNTSLSCTTSTSCGYTITKFLFSGSTGDVTGATAPPYPVGSGDPEVSQGFGKGVLFWETEQQAATFLQYSDILSADSYWDTDPDLQVASQGGCGLMPNSSTVCNNGGGSGLTAQQAELPANYAYDVTKLESEQALNGSQKPIVVDVETGCPGFTINGNASCSTPPQTIAAAWHALIAGARGIIWFQHNFGGPCEDDRSFIDGSNPNWSMYTCQQTPGVTLHDMVESVSAFDHEVGSLNNVLLSPTANGYVTTTGDVSTMAKAYGGSCYVFTGSGQPANPPADNQNVAYNLADGYSGPINVIDENRTITATNGDFTDTYANANTIHIYQIPGNC